MKELKNEIENLLIKNSVDEETGASREKVIYSDDFKSIAEDICSLIQVVFDPENQPNQLGIKNPFEKDKKNEFERAVEPAIKYLFKNHNPHTKIFIDYDRAELLQGEMTHNLSELIPD